jgi:hypothetical protein
MLKDTGLNNQFIGIWAKLPSETANWRKLRLLALPNADNSWPLSNVNFSCLFCCVAANATDLAARARRGGPQGARAFALFPIRTRSGERV